MNCSRCCRQHLIEITEEERQRILAQNWTAQDGIPTDRPLIVRFGPPWRRRYRLGHQADGACVFLNEQGLCRIHAKFGEEAKPLPCRLYPYAFHPAGKAVTVSLRFSCPAVVRNWGQPVSAQADQLRRLAAEVVPETATQVPPPWVSKNQRLEWSDFLKLVERLDQTLASPAPVTVKLLRALFWVRAVGEAKFEKIRGQRLDELLDILTEAAENSVTEETVAQSERPTRTGRTQFRLLVAQYARKDTLVDLESGWKGRWRLFRAALSFARGRGNVPPLQDVFTPVPFESLEQPFGPLPAEAEEMFTRYFRVKIQGIHFCGRAYYDLPFVEGFFSLVLIYPAILWLARWLAVGKGRHSLKEEDVVQAITTADHYHAYSPVFGKATFRRRVRILAQLGDIERLCCWYAR